MRHMRVCDEPPICVQQTRCRPEKADRARTDEHDQNRQTLTVSKRKAIVEQVGRLDHVAYRTEDVIYPVAIQDVVRELGQVMRQCLECKECGLLRESRKGIEAHFSGVNFSKCCSHIYIYTKQSLQLRG